MLCQGVIHASSEYTLPQIWFTQKQKHQFATRVNLQIENIEQVTRIKILGTELSDKLTWDVNCSVIIRRCHMRFQFLQVVASFGTDP